MPGEQATANEEFCIAKSTHHSIYTYHCPICDGTITEDLVQTESIPRSDKDGDKIIHTCSADKYDGKCCILELYRRSMLDIVKA